MTKMLAGAVALLAIPVAAPFGLVAIVSAASAGSGAAAGRVTFNPSEEALADIPPGLIDLYTRAVASCTGLRWQVLAGVAKVESDHGRFAGAQIDVNGDVWPQIIGIPLNGTAGTAAIPDTDDGHLDGDVIWDRAVGPFQFIPSSWAIFGIDGNGDGTADPHNIHDAASAAVGHLCPTGDLTDIEGALFGYNNSTEYVANVLEWANRYSGGLASIGPVVAGYAYPLPAVYATLAQAQRSHHTYPAVDFRTADGTPIYSVVAGEVAVAVGEAGVYDGSQSGRCGNTVVVAGVDGASYTYCHLTAVVVAPGQGVAAGQLLGATGGTPGAPGAGNTTGPHLHLGIRVHGQAVCPQPILVAILLGDSVPPAVAPTAGCVTGTDTTDWISWLEELPR